MASHFLPRINQTCRSHGIARHWIWVVLLAATACVAATNVHGNSVKKNAAIQVLTDHIRSSHTGFECKLSSHAMIVTDPWSGKADRIPFTDLLIFVDHPRVGRADTDSNGLRTPLSVRAQRAHVGWTPQQCIIYSKLTVPERVSLKTWANVDQILSALLVLGGTVKQSRPPADPSLFDEEDPSDSTPLAEPSPTSPRSSQNSSEHITLSRIP